MKSTGLIGIEEGVGRRNRRSGLRAQLRICALQFLGLESRLFTRHMYAQVNTHTYKNGNLASAYVLNLMPVLLNSLI